MKRPTFPMATIALLFVVAGCGQSGPLYVPGNPSTMAVPPTASSAESDAPGEQDEQVEDADSPAID